MNAHACRLALLCTGGTIAGRHDDAAASSDYVAGVLPGEALLHAVPELDDLAHWHVEDLLSLDSKDMQPEHWLRIAKRVEQLADYDDIDGVVITHGTDTLEETALFLDLVLETRKPVVITGAMRPASAVSADGPGNLIDAARLAGTAEAAGCGVLICFAEQILPARTARKQHAGRLAAFHSTEPPLGFTRPYLRLFAGAHPETRCLKCPHSLPQVEILYVSAGSHPALAEAAVEQGAKGLVLALPGNGSLPEAWVETLRALGEKGIPLVRASRCGDSDIGPRQTDHLARTWPAGVLSPCGARVALMLALANTSPKDTERAGQLFSRIARCPSTQS